MTDRTKIFSLFKVHSKKELSLLQLFELFATEESAEQWFIKTRWPDGIACVKCGSIKVTRRSCHPTQPFHCGDCGKFFSVKVDTIMHGSKLSYRKWAIAIHLFMSHPKGISAKQLADDLDVAYKTAWHLGHRIREAMRPEEDEVFEGPVEVDEAWVGGRKRNQKWIERQRNRMIPVVGMIDRFTGRVAAEPVKARSAGLLQSFIYRHTYEDTPVFTDEARAYDSLARPHETVNHSEGEYGLTNGIESFWNILKRAYKGTYHKMTPKHLHRYVTEFQERHNMRELSDIERMWSVVWGGVGKRLRYEDLIS